jgi:acyl-coenzyme A synthetase/AMP-(fatty) acid ligase/aryl carrier-like protein
MAKPDHHCDGAYLAELIRSEGVTTLHFTPSMLAAFLQVPAVRQCVSVRRVICSGETLPASLAKRFFDVCTAQLHNLYGPTEAAVDVSFWECPRGGVSSVVPIGRPIGNIEMHVLDEAMDAVPLGVAGEIYLGGVGLGRGYLRRPGLSAERFVPHPRAKRSGDRLYRTGDSGRYLEDGTIEYLGRLDSQLKIKGVRIEPAEIEAVLQQHHGVRQAVVTTREDELGEKHLIAYLRIDAEAELDSEALREALKERLPRYMIPSYLMQVQEFPLTPSGKLNRQALPAVTLQVKEGAQKPVEPGPSLEAMLGQTWAEVLGLEQVGVDDNFFELGGNSLQMTQISSRLRERSAFEISFAQFFAQPTIAGLARLLRGSAVDPGTESATVPNRLPRG